MNLSELITPASSLPIVSVNATIEDAHSTMSSFGLGFCYITTSDNHLIGVFTDGDFRRLMFDTSSISSIFYNYNIIDYCTLSPLSLDLSSDTLSPEIVSNIFISNRIYDLPITSLRTLVGSLNVRDVLAYSFSK